MAQALIFVSIANREEARMLGIGQDGQYRLIRSGVPLKKLADIRERVDRAQVRSALDLPANARIVTTLSAYKPQKNLADFVELAERILKDGTVEERKEIKMVNDPSPLAEYKKTIQPMILTGCATAACHGGSSGGKLFLYGTPDGDAATYTNFYLITQTNTQVGGAERMMIDRSYSDKSLIALFGLPSEVSKASHPEVKGVTWRTLFRSKEDPQYKSLLRWIDKLKKPEPDYGFTFSLEAAEPKPDEKPAPAPVTPEK